MSQQTLAVSAGLSIGVIHKVEQGVQSVELETVARISAALSAPLETLLGAPTLPRSRFLLPPKDRPFFPWASCCPFLLL